MRPRSRWFQEPADLHSEARDGGAGQSRARAMERTLGELIPAGLAVDLDLFLTAEHQPAFLHTSGGVGAQLGAIIVRSGHGYFNDQFGGAGMLPPEIARLPADHGQVGFGLGIHAGDWLLGADHEAARYRAVKQVLQ